jgi:xylan 1,4-beta-xylosidase
VSQFTKHVVERYGLDEVSTWYFEVWNEPNIHFWVGEPKDKSYQALYERAARAIKRVSPRLRVGGPATAQAAWADRFLKWAHEKKVPVDFFSTHVYGNDSSEDVFGTHEKISRNEMVCRAAKKVRDQVKASPLPNTPIIWSEYNASWKNEPHVTDALYMGPWLADTIRQCDGLADIMAYWSMSDVFEEQGVVKEPFYGGYGLFAAGNLPKPALNAFSLLHDLGVERIPVESRAALATKRADGTLVVAVYNLALPEEKGAPKTVNLVFKNQKGTQVSVRRLDADHGSLLSAYEKMGRPRYPTAKQKLALRNAAALAPSEKMSLKDGVLTLNLPAHGLAIVEVK